MKKKNIILTELVHQNPKSPQGKSSHLKINPTHAPNCSICNLSLRDAAMEIEAPTELAPTPPTVHDRADISPHRNQSPKAWRHAHSKATKTSHGGHNQRVPRCHMQPRCAVDMPCLIFPPQGSQLPPSSTCPLSQPCSPCSNSLQSYVQLNTIFNHLTWLLNH